MTDDRPTLPSGKAVVYEARDIFDLLARTRHNQVLVDDAGRPATGAELKLDLMARKDASALFGNLLEGIFSNIEQTSLIVNPLVEPMR